MLTSKPVFDSRCQRPLKCFEREQPARRRRRHAAHRRAAPLRRCSRLGARPRGIGTESCGLSMSGPSRGHEIDRQATTARTRKSTGWRLWTDLAGIPSGLLENDVPSADGTSFLQVRVHLCWLCHGPVRPPWTVRSVHGLVFPQVKGIRSSAGSTPPLCHDSPVVRLFRAARSGVAVSLSRYLLPCARHGMRVRLSEDQRESLRALLTPRISRRGCGARHDLLWAGA